MACVETPQSSALIPETLYESLYSGPDLISRVASLAVSYKPTAEVKSSHALSILARVAKDPTLSFSAIGLTAAMGPVPLGRVVETCKDKLHEYLGGWWVGDSQEELDKKMGELVWMNTVIYAAAGFGDRKYSADESKEFKGDFYL